MMVNRFFEALRKAYVKYIREFVRRYRFNPIYAPLEDLLPDIRRVLGVELTIDKAVELLLEVSARYPEVVLADWRPGGLHNFYIRGVEV